MTTATPEIVRPKRSELTKLQVQTMYHNVTSVHLIGDSTFDLFGEAIAEKSRSIHFSVTAKEAKTLEAHARRFQSNPFTRSIDSLKQTMNNPNQTNPSVVSSRLREHDLHVVLVDLSCEYNSLVSQLTVDQLMARGYNVVVIAVVYSYKKSDEENGLVCDALRGYNNIAKKYDRFIPVSTFQVSIINHVLETIEDLTKLCQANRFKAQVGDAKKRIADALHLGSAYFNKHIGLLVTNTYFRRLNRHSNMTLIGAITPTHHASGFDNMRSSIKPLVIKQKRVNHAYAVCVEEEGSKHLILSCVK